MAITAVKYEAQLSFNAKDYKKGMSDAKADFNGFKSSVSSVCGVVGKTLTTAIGAASTAIGALATYSASVGKSFEASMSQVAATMGMSAEEIANGSEEFEKLKAAAQEAGATTKYSASEAADALNYLALAGYDADKACEVLPSVLNLAQAGALDLAYASDLATDAMGTLGIEATKDNLTHFADQLAKTASKSNTSVQQLGEAILTVGGTANYLAGGTNELNTALGILANNGIKGAEGGTHLRNVLLSLSAPTDTAKAALDSLGLSCEDLQDADGNLLPLNEIMQKLNDSMSDLSQTEKADVLSNLFNKTDLTSVNALLKDCGDSWDELNANIKDCDGACQTMADTMANNLEGQIASAKSAAEAFGIAIYDEMQTPLTDLAKVGTQSIRDLTKAFQEGGVNQLIETASKMFADLLSKALQYVPKILDLAINVINTFVKGIADNSGSIADSAMSIITVLVEGIGSMLPNIVNAAALIITNLVNSISSQLPTLIPIAVQAIMDFCQALVDNLPMLVTAALQLVQALAEGILNALPSFIQSVFQIVDSLQNTIIQALPQILEVGTQILVALLQGIIDNLPMILDGCQQLMSSLTAGLQEVTPQLIELTIQLIAAVVDVIMQTDWISLGQQLLTYIITGIGDMLELAIDIAVQVGTALFDAIDKIDWLQLGKNIIDYIINGIKALISTIVSTGLDVGTKVFNKIKSIDWIGLGKSLINMCIEGIQATANAIMYANQQLFTNIFNAIKNIDWRGLGATIIETVKNGVTNVANNLVNAAKNAGQNALNAIKNLLWNSTGADVIRNIISGLQSMVNNLTTTARNIFNSAREAFSNVSFWDIGSNIVTGIINGVQSGAQALYDTLCDLAENALNAAKEWLGIASPSKEFAKIGGFMMEGWRKPVEEDTSLISAVQNTADSTLKTAQDGLNKYNKVMSGFTKGAKGTIKLNASVDDSELKNVKVGSSLVGGMSDIFNGFISSSAKIFDGLKANISGGNTSTAQNNYVFNIGNNVYNISGVLDKDAAEQVKDIADGQISEFADMVAEYIPT